METKKMSQYLDIQNYKKCRSIVLSPAFDCCCLLKINVYCVLLETLIGEKV